MFLVRAHLCESKRKQNSKFLSANYKAANSITNWYWEAKLWEPKPSKFRVFFMQGARKGWLWWPACPGGRAALLCSCPLAGPGMSPGSGWLIL